MITRLLLLTAVAAAGYYVFVRRTRLPINILLVLALLAGAAVLVVWPDLSTRVARMVGVGRGVDLVNYLVDTVLLFLALHYMMKFRAQEQKLATIVRELALLRAGPLRDRPPPGDREQE